MNLLVNGFHDPQQIPVLKGLLLMDSVDQLNVLTVRALESSLLSEFPEVRLLFWEDLYWDFRGYRNHSAENSISVSLWEKLAKCENQALKMMDRYEFLKSYGYQERKNIFLKLVQFWYDYLIRNDIDFFFSQNVPHEVFDFVLLELCRIMQIGTLMLYQSQIRDHIVPMKHYEDGVIGLVEGSVGISSSSESTISEDFISEINQIKNDSIPFYMEKKSVFSDILDKLVRIITLFKMQKSLFRSKMSSTALRLRFRIFLRKLFIRVSSQRLRRYYNKRSIWPSIDKDFVYAPLHYQPELTTNPLAGPFVDQYLIIDMLALNLPAEVLVYVKEHPKQESVGRDVNMYDLMFRHKNVRFIDVNYPSHKLIDNCLCVATSTGTAGWEALVKNKPVLVFGDIFFSQAPRAYRIRNSNDLLKAYSELRNSEDLEELKLRFFEYCGLLESCTISGFCDPIYEKISTLTFAASNNNILKYVKKYIDNYFRSEHAKDTV